MDHEVFILLSTGREKAKVSYAICSSNLYKATHSAAILFIQLTRSYTSKTPHHMSNNSQSDAAYGRPGAGGFRPSSPAQTEDFSQVRLPTIPAGHPFKTLTGISFIDRCC